MLRAEREKYGLGLDDVALRLRIRPAYLRALEDDAYHLLPGATYATGFLRSYADFLGLDRDDVIGRYLRRTQVQEETDDTRPLRHPIEHDEPRIPRGAVVVLCIALASAAVYGGSRLFSDDKLPSVDRVAQVPDRLIAGNRPTTGSAGLTFQGRQDPSSAFAAVTPQPGENDANSGLNRLPNQPQIASTPQPGGAPPAAAPAAPGSYVTLPRGTFEPQNQDQPLPKRDRLDLNQGPAVPVVPSGPQTTSAIERTLPPPLPQNAVAAPKNPPMRDSQIAAMPRSGDSVVVARIDSWIEIKDGSGRVLASQLLRVGESFRLPVGADYRLRTGDVRALDVRINGLAVPQRVTPDRIHKVMSLDGERLQSGNAVID